MTFPGLEWEQHPLHWSLVSLIFLVRGQGERSEICRLISGSSCGRAMWLCQETSGEPQRHQLPCRCGRAPLLKEHKQGSVYGVGAQVGQQVSTNHWQWSCR